MRGNIGFGLKLPNAMSNVRHTLVPFSTFSNSGSASGGGGDSGGGRGRGRGSSLPSLGPLDFDGRALGKPDSGDSKFDSPESLATPGSGLGHGRGKPLPPPSSDLPAFSPFMSSLKQRSTGRGQVTGPGQVSGPVASQPANDSVPKKPIFFKREDGSSPTGGAQPNVSSSSDRDINHKLPGNIPEAFSGFGRGKPMKQPDPKDQVREENRHLRAPRAPDTAAFKTVPETQPALSQEDAVKNARKILSQRGDQGSSTGGGGGAFRGGRGQGRGRGRGRGRERFTGRGRKERADWEEGTEDTPATGFHLEDNADYGEELAKKVGPEVMNQLVEGFEEVADRVLPSPLEDEYLDALDLNCAIEFEPEYLMGEFDRNPDIDEKPPIPLRDALEKMKPFLMAYEGIQSQEEWEEIMEETMARVPLMKKIVDHYSGPDRVTAKKQQEELERVSKTLPQSAPSSVKRFTDRAVLSLQSNPGWGFDKKCQFMDKLVWEVSQHYK